MTNRSDSSKKLRDHLKELAITVDVSSTVPILSYYDIAKSLENTAVLEWKKHNNLEQAYVHLMKLSILLLDKIPSHNGFLKKQFEGERFWAKRVAKETLEQLERFVAALDRIEDEKLLKQELDLIEEFDRPEESLPSISIVATDNDNDGVVQNQAVIVDSSKPDVYDEFSIFESKPTILASAPPVEYMVASPASTFPAPTTMNSSNDVDKARLYNLLRLPGATSSVADNPPSSSLSAAALPTVKQSTDALTPKSYLPPPYSNPASQQPYVPSSFTNNTLPVDNNASLSPSPYLTHTNSDDCLVQDVYRSPVEPFDPISSQEKEILLFLGDYLRYPLPRPRSTQLTLRLSRRGVTVTHILAQDDYHVSFQIFLSQLPPYLQVTPSAIETNRCFFIHLGVALGIHPFALQTAFRIRTHQLLKRSSTDDLAKELISTLTSPADLVDANALIYLWPKEFNSLRLGILSGTPDQPILSIFSSSKISSNQKPTDRILRCSGCHFTYLRPVVDQTSMNRQKNTQYLPTLQEDMKSSGYKVLEYPVDESIGSWSLLKTLQTAIMT